MTTTTARLNPTLVRRVWSVLRSPHPRCTTSATMAVWVRRQRGARSGGHFAATDRAGPRRQSHVHVVWRGTAQPSSGNRALRVRLQCSRPTRPAGFVVCGNRRGRRSRSSPAMVDGGFPLGHPDASHQSHALRRPPRYPPPLWVPWQRQQRRKVLTCTPSKILQNDTASLGSFTTPISVKHRQQLPNSGMTGVDDTRSDGVPR